MTTVVLSMRVNNEERALLEAASTLARTSLGDFIRRKALDAAEADILERRIVTIPAKDWEAFEAWVNRPPEEIAGLKDLARLGAYAHSMADGDFRICPSSLTAQ